MPGTGAKLIDRFSAPRVRTATVVTADFRGLRKLAVASREAFRLGVVLYDGERIVPFGERLFAAPISCVWG